LWVFLRGLPENLKLDDQGSHAGVRSFLGLFRIPSLRIVTLFVSIGTFGLFLVYTWLPTFLYDKFSLGLARAGFEASIYPQIGTALGLFIGGTVAARGYRRTEASRFWVAAAGFLFGAPCIFCLGAVPTLALTRVSAIAFGFFMGFVSGNQAPCAFDVVPAPLRASTTGVLNLAGASVSGFAPFLGGLSRKTIGVDRLMSLTAGVFLIAGGCLLFWVPRHLCPQPPRAGETAPGRSQSPHTLQL